MGETAGEDSDPSTTGPITAGRPRARFGVGLILLSGVLWFSLFAIPFLPMSVAQRAAFAAAVFAGVQIAWWVGVALAGPQAVKRLRSFFKRSKRPAAATESAGRG